MEPTNDQKVEPIENVPVLKDAETVKRIHEHLSNPDDVITEDDIRNAVTDIFETT